MKERESQLVYRKKSQPSTINDFGEIKYGQWLGREEVKRTEGRKAEDAFKQFFTASSTLVNFDLVICTIDQ